MNKPYEIADQEWAELAALREVRECIPLLEDAEDPAEALKEYAYAVRFDYADDGPGFCGPLYLLKGGADAGQPPIAIIRAKEGLEVLPEWD